MAFIESVLVLAAYFAPSIVALLRHAANKWRVVAVNTLLGWTFIGWVVALVMALPGHGQQPQITNVTVTQVNQSDQQL